MWQSDWKLQQVKGLLYNCIPDYSLKPVTHHKPFSPFIKFCYEQKIAFQQDASGDTEADSSVHVEYWQLIKSATSNFFS